LNRREQAARRRWRAYLAALVGTLVCNNLLAVEAEASVVEIVVTGSRLSSANSSNPSPIVVLDNAELLHQGTSRVEDLLNSLPQANSGVGYAELKSVGTVEFCLRSVGKGPPVYTQSDG
jgi:phospholipase/lecithinase/hemolysin